MLFLIHSLTALSQEQKVEVISLPVVQFEQMKLAISYGAQAMDELEILEQRLVNEQEKTTNYKNINKNLQIQIEGMHAANKKLIDSFYQNEKNHAKERRGSFWKGAKVGAIVGAVVSVIALSVY